MRAPPSIRRTLLDELFRKPRPLSFHQFQKARLHLFPGERAFRQFLTSDDNQQLSVTARSILLRLAYQHFVSPPSRLLLNLAGFEDGVRDQVKAGDYVPRDHFIHLVNLYLLGIYIFGYHRAIHAACVTELQRSKRSFLRGAHQSTGRDTGHATVYHLFASTWSQFVLTHDLGYPLEKLGPTQREANQQWLKPFSKIRKSIVKDLSLEALSRLLVAKGVLDDSPLPLHSVYLDHEDSFTVTQAEPGERRRHATVRRVQGRLVSDASEALGDWAVSNVAELLETWADARLLTKVRTRGALGLLGGLIPDRQLCAVLESGSGAPVVLVFRDSESEPVWFNAGPEAAAGVRKDSRALWAMAFVDAVSPSEDYRWQYFALRPSESVAALIREVPGLSAEVMDRLLQSLASDEEFRGLAATEHDPVAAEAFIAYDRMCHLLGYLEDDDVGDRSTRLFAGYAAGFESVSRRLPVLASDVVGALLRDALAKDGTINAGEVLLTTNRTEAVKKIAGVVWRVIAATGRPALEARLAEAMTPLVTERIGLEEGLRSAHKAIRLRLESLLGQESEAGNPFATARFDANFSLASIPSDAEELQAMNTRLEERGIGTLGFLSGSYRPKWAQQDKAVGKSFVDHGLAAAHIAGGIVATYKDVATALKQQHNAPAECAITLLRLAAGTTSTTDERWLEFEIHMLGSLVGFAAALHNLYPADLKGEKAKYRTRLSREPFAYLALLADGLQKWDRRSLVKFPDSDVRLSPAGSRFDLRVVGNLLVISLSAPRLNMSDEDAALRKTLDTYLEDASSLVRLGLAEEV